MPAKKPVPPPLSRETMSIREVSEVLGISQKTTQRHLHDGTLPATRLGGKWFIPKASIEKITGKK